MNGIFENPSDVSYGPPTTKIPLRPAICRTCKYCCEKLIGKEKKLVCVHECPIAGVKEYAVWPIVEENDWCRRHKYDGKLTNN